MIIRTLNVVLLLAGLGLAMAPAAPAAESIRKTAPRQEDIDRALALVSCKADRTAFRTLAYQLRDIATSGKPSAGWQQIAGKAGGYSNALGDMPGVVAEMQLAAPVLVFGHPSTRLILSRSSVVAVFDEALAADLSKALSLDTSGAQGVPAGMRLVRSAPEAHGDGIEVMALVAQRIEADPVPIAVAGCLYFTR
ncbi:hypothetical protein CR919_01530 [Stenotrophomonas sp. LMG 10879]|uniref:hypothetical protein n=1 Tax=Stenotrophomonas sp. LMG 10879 TaxID=487706 RepID=UPI000C175914|nr:hypothetical protein [Stenotrophomonas sp. LMG 10879]MBN5048860.1 hypothetical protein [Stenotrophomonas maltophilia]PII21665.1 hypothetical protein CR919_01530 [Stenotrophomonas sp. LMG 10879]